MGVESRTMGWTTEVKFPAVEIFLYSTESRPAVGLTQPPILETIQGDKPAGA
jgi:hypothetical protein